MAAVSTTSDSVATREIPYDWVWEQSADGNVYFLKNRVGRVSAVYEHDQWTVWVIVQGRVYQGLPSPWLNDALIQLMRLLYREQVLGSVPASPPKEAK